jgi:hypothetical protein
MSTEKPEDGRERCGGKLRDGSGGTCKLPAGHGTDHVGIGRCRRHGGNTESHKQNALMIQGQRDVAKWGARRDIAPAEALLELVQWKAAEVEFWHRKVNSLADHELTWSRTKRVDRVGGEKFSGVEETEEALPHIYVKLLHQAQKTLADFCTAAIRAGADQALVAAAQSRAVIWLGAMRRMLTDSRVQVEGDPETVIFDALQQLRKAA